MTGKELLYVEDALGHIKHFKTLCSNYANTLEDPTLKAFVQELSKKNEALEQRFISVLGGATNGR